MPNPIIEKINVGGQDFEIAGSGQGNSIIHYPTEAAMDADWSNIDNESDIVTEEEDDYDLTASMIAYGQNSNVETEIDQINQHLTEKADKLSATNSLSIFFYNSGKTDANGFCYTNDIYFPYEGTVTLTGAIIFNGGSPVTPANPIIVRYGDYLHIRHTSPIEGTMQTSFRLS